MSRWTPKTQKFRNARNELRKMLLPCWICGGAIDYNAPQSHPLAFEADHIYPPDLRPDLAECVQGLRAAHGRCNRRRGRPGRHGTPLPRRTMLDWET